MSLRINDEAPNFTAETTQGTIDFHDWIGNGWAVLFSHPKDFTPVCTTELGYVAKNKTAHELPIHSWNLIGPSVVSALKSGAMLPSWTLICPPHFWQETRIDLARATVNAC